MVVTVRQGVLKRPSYMMICKTPSITQRTSRTVFSTGSDSVVFCYSVVILLRVVIHDSKNSKSVPNVVIHYFSVVNHYV